MKSRFLIRINFAVSCRSKFSLNSNFALYVYKLTTFSLYSIKLNDIIPILIFYAITEFMLYFDDLPHLSIISFVIIIKQCITRSMKFSLISYSQYPYLPIIIEPPSNHVLTTYNTMQYNTFSHKKLSH